MSDLDEPLSPAGVARREQIRRLARRAAAGRRWRRRAGRTAIVAAVLAAAAPLLWPRRPAPPASPHPPTVVARRRDPTPPPPVTSVVTYVATDATITDRWSVRPTPPRWVVIGDRELLDTLAAAGRPAGLMTVDGHERLLFRDASR
jgi:hypothetical protein